jgi:lantibiotic modifying enzyme
VVLDGPLRQQALGIVRTIASSLESLPLESANLGSGAAGLAVCFAYLAEGLAEHRYEAIARRLLDQAITMVEAEPMIPSLFGGLAGIGWAASHIGTRLHWTDLEQTLTEIDETLCDCLDQSVWQEGYPLSSGLVGLGVYGLERLGPADDARPPAAVHILERVVGHLLATVERKPDGATWWTSPERLSLHARKKMPDGAHAVGLSEGVAGVVAFLGRVCAAAHQLDPLEGKIEELARPLLDDAARWVLAQEAPEGPPEGFPYAIRPNRPQRNWTRSAWSHGDPGVAAALLEAARCVGEPAWEERALMAAVRATTRPVDRTRVFDAGLAAGAAGLGHVFNRLFQATGEPRLAARSRFWFARTMEMRRPGQGIAGYAAWGPDENAVESWLDDPGIIFGAAGIALALLSAATPFEPSWDRMMLVDLRGLEP